MAKKARKYLVTNKLPMNNPDERNALSTQAQWDEIVDLCARIRADQSATEAKAPLISTIRRSAGERSARLRATRRASAGRSWRVASGPATWP